MTSASVPHRVGRRDLLAVSAVLSLGIVPASSERIPARQPNAEPTLLVRGEIAITADSQLTWRVVREMAEAPPDAAFEERATGFVVASTIFTSFLVTDEATGSAYRLAFEEAAFVRGGTVQRAESLAEDPVQYLRFKLVAPTAPEDASGYNLVFSGPAFAVPAGTITLSLQRAELMVGDTVALPSGTGETLVLVEQGEVDLDMAAAPRAHLRTTVALGTDYAVRSVGGAGTLSATRDATYVLIATIA